MRLVPLVIWLIGCAATPPPEKRTLTLGHLDDGAFTAYQPNEDVTLVAGAQGGLHVWLSFEMAPAMGGEAELERTAHRRIDDQLVLRTNGTVELDQKTSLPMFMCPSPVGISVIDQPIEYQLRFHDDGGELAKGAITLVPHCPADQLEFCQRICQG